MNQSTGRTVYYAAASFDGYIAEMDNSLDWLFDYDGSYEGGEPSEGSYESFSTTWARSSWDRPHTR
jgi:hypothetical protein